ncbi:MAG: hypothetical protein IT445_08140 [Phycisphaeraceae bacterium]|nr:hypothetical protein [Phycisphaeraceae bacterium]
MTRRTTAASVLTWMIGATLTVAPAASANTVVLGNLVTTNNLGQYLNVNGITGGPYNRVTFTTNWSANTSGATSIGAAINFNLSPSFYNIIASLDSISGYQNNSNSTSLTAVCNLSMPVSSASALTMIRGQNISAGGFISANWSTTTLNFSYYQRPKVIPTGIVALGIRGNTSSAFSVTTGGIPGGFDPAVGLYSSEGYLVASNVGVAGNAGTVPETGIMIDEPAGDPGLSNLMLPEGTYFLFAGGEGTTFTPDDFVANVPTNAIGGTLSGIVGDGSWGDQATLGTGEGRWYSFVIVPEPGALSVLVLAGMLLSRRR